MCTSVRWVGEVLDHAHAEVDILIIGAGPVGLFAAYYAGFRGLTTALIDSLPEPGGRVKALFPHKAIYDVAGLPSVTGADLVDNLLAQAARFSPTYLLGETADKLSRLDDGRIRVTTVTGTRVTCRAIVVSGGIGAFTPRALSGGEAWEGRGLSYFVPYLVPTAQDFKGKNVVVVGGGDSAFDWALALHDIAESVTVVHRRRDFRAHEHTVRHVRHLGVEVLTPYVVSSIRGSDTIAELEISDTDTERTRVLPCDAVLPALGFIADLGPLANWGLEISDQYIVVDSRMATTAPGIYAAGDVTQYPGKLRLLTVGFGEAATAVNNAAAAIDPSADLFPGHSTDLIT